MQWVTDNLGISAGVQGNILESLAVVIGLWLVRGIVIHAVRTRVDEPQVVYQTRKGATYVATFIAIISLAWIWVDAFDSLATYLGLLSAGIAIALSDVLRNVAGWVFVLTRRPFRLGDRIEVDGTRGDVVDIRLFRFSVMEVGNWVDADQSTGRMIHLPNGLVFTSQIANYTEGFGYVWHEIPVLITFESDWRKAQSIIHSVLAEHAPPIEREAGHHIRATAESYHIKVGALTPTVYMTVRDSGVLLTARYLVEARQRRGVEEKIWGGILDSFNSSSTIELAYPTVRTYFEGPVALRSEPAD